MDKDFQYAYVVTGGIATGKSTFLSYFSDFDVVDADKIAHELLDIHSEEIKDMFGSACVKEGKVDRKILGELVFSQETKRAQLESFIHPFIREEIFSRCERLELNAKPYFVDIPLYFESGEYDFSKVILVYAPYEVQLKRLMRRNDLSEEQAQKRLDAQIHIEEKKLKASFVVDNSHDKESLKNEVERFKDYADLKI